MEPHCSNCAAYYNLSCHRHPPIGNAGSSAQWPMVQPTDWCYEWVEIPKPKPLEVDDQP